MCVREVCQIRQSMNSRYQISPGYRLVSVWNEVCKAAWEKHLTCSSYIRKLYQSNEAQAVSQSHWQLVTGHWSWQTSVFPWRFIQEKSWKPSETKLVCWGISHLFSGPRFLLALIHLNPFNASYGNLTLGRVNVGRFAVRQPSWHQRWSWDRAMTLRQEI